jgi:hypothetical protein
MSRGCRAVSGDSVGFIWGRNRYMRNLFIIGCCIVAFFVGCDDRCDHCNDGPYPRNHYFLVNATDKQLHYVSYNIDTLIFEAILFPGDTLFLYSRKHTPPGESIKDSACFFWYSCRPTLIISDNNQLLYNNQCGETDFIKKEIDEKNYNLYWTIDSAYIARYSCDITWEGFEERFLKNE